MTSRSIIQTHAQSRALEDHQEALNAPSTSRNELTDEGEFLSSLTETLRLGLHYPTPQLRLLHHAVPTTLEFTPHVILTMPWTFTVMATLVAMVVTAEIAICLPRTCRISHYQTHLSLPTQHQLRTPCSFSHKWSRPSYVSLRHLLIAIHLLAAPRSASQIPLTVLIRANSTHISYNVN